MDEGEAAGSAVRRARRLRRAMTEAEQRLWRLLRDRRLQDHKFRRQVPLGPFFADFVCFELRLIIEADGSQHAQSIRDERRDGWFRARDFRVMRFWNNDILARPEEVLTAILGAVETPHRSPRGTRGPPSPTRGEGKTGAARRK